jgi:NAD(P)-dependent dehydrogenase (short-subunit alcohol dehydrogenase family)
MTKKCIAILGAGPGLGLALARRYGKDGYAVALVGRRAEVVQTQSQQLIAEGVAAQGFKADLREPAQVSAVVADILSRFGRIDVLYYGPNAPEAFVPAASLSVDDVKDKVELFLYGLVAAVRGVLPSMQSQQQGAILVGLGGSAAVGLPFVSGPGPALAGARNYLYSLHGELAPQGIHVAMLTVVWDHLVVHVLVSGA